MRYNETSTAYFIKNIGHHHAIMSQASDFQVVQHEDPIDIEEVATCVEDTEQDATTKPNDPPDGGYGWVVAIASCFAVFFSVGNVFLFSVFLPVYVDEFNSPQGATAWVGSISGGLMTALGIFVGAFSDYYGNDRIIFVGALLIFIGFMLASFATELWHLYLTHGIITGTGMSCVFISAIGVTGPWFTSKRALALGIAFSGSGLGQLALIFVANALIQRYGWRGCLRGIAVIEGVCIAISSLFIRRFSPLRSELALNASWGMFGDTQFLTLYAGVAINALGLFVPLIFLIIYAKHQGISTNQAVAISALGGIGSMIGRIVSGYIGDKMGSCLITLKIYMICCSLTTFCLLACTEFASIFVYTFIYAFLAGAVLSLVPAVCAEMFGVKTLGSIMGLLLSAQAMGNFFSSPIGGSLYDVSRSYTYTIITSAGLSMIGAIVLFFIPGTDPWGGYGHYFLLSSSACPPPSPSTTANKSDAGNMRIDDWNKETELSVVESPSSMTVTTVELSYKTVEL